MNLAWHILRYDVRQFWPGIAAWILLTVSSAVYQAQAAQLPVESSAVGLLWFGATVGTFARWLLGMSLIVLIVQSHALVGTTAFWMTRPIAPRVLLLSRLLLFGIVFAAVPALCDLVLMSWHGVPPGASARVIAEWSIVRSLGVLLVMSGAAATATFARFVLLAGILVTTVMLALAGGMLSLTRVTQRVGDAFVLPENAVIALTSRWPDQTAVVIAWLVGIAGLLVLLRSRYHRRPLARAGWLAGATAVAAAGVVTFWPWNLLHAAVATPPWAGPGGTLQLSAPSGQAIFFDNAGLRSGPQILPRWRTAHGRIYVSGLPQGWYAMAHVLSGVLSFAGREVTSGPAPYVVPLSRDEEGRDTRTTAIEEVLDVETLNGSRLRDTTASAPLLRLLSDETPAVPVDGTYEGQIEVGLHEVQIAHTSRPEAGVRFQDGAYRLMIQGVRLTEGGPRLDVQWSDVTSVFDRHPDPRYQVFLRNRSLGEALSGELRSITLAAPSPETMLLGRLGNLATAFGFRTEAGVINFPSTTAAQLPSARLPNGQYAFDDEPWMRDAEVVIVRTVHRGVVRRTVRIERVAVNGGASRP
jgi:hypothetical protein